MVTTCILLFNFIIMFTRLYLAVKLVFAVAIFISYGLQFYVPAFTVFPVITNAFAGSINPTYSDAIVRIGAVIFTCKFTHIILF